MSDKTDYTDYDVATLEEKKAAFEEMGWDDQLEAVEAALAEKRDSQEKIVALKNEIARAKANGLSDDPAVEALEERVSELEATAESDEPEPDDTGPETLSPTFTSGLTSFEARREAKEESDDGDGEPDIEALKEKKKNFEKVGWDNQAEELEAKIESLEADSPDTSDDSDSETVIDTSSSGDVLDF